MDTKKHLLIITYLGGDMHSLSPLAQNYNLGLPEVGKLIKNKVTLGSQA